MTARRAAFGFLAFVCLALLVYSGGAIWLWILMFQGLILLFGFLNVATTLTYLTVNQVMDGSSAQKDGTAVFSLTVYNTSFLPYCHLSFGLSTAESAIDGEPRTFRAAVMPKSSVTHKFELRCPFRGEYDIGVTYVEATDLFGLVRVRRDRERINGARPSKLIIYPRLVDIERGIYLNRDDNGTSGSNRSRADELSDISDLRGYREGDPLKRIHWKLSARMRSFIVKEYDGSVSSQNLVLLDCSNHGLSGVQAAQFEETVCETAASFSKLFCDAYTPVRLTTYGNDRAELSGGTPREFDALYYHLARVKFGGSLPLADALGLEAERGLDSLVLITGTPSAELFERLCALADSGCLISLVLAASPSERVSRMLNELLARGVNITAVGGERSA